MPVTTKHNRPRSGLTLIEVLVSMIVATVGIIGVMLMIPFAIRQTQRGLDLDLAETVGRNAIEELQMKGVFRATTIRDGNVSDRVLDMIGFPSTLNDEQLDFTVLGSRPIATSYSLLAPGRIKDRPGLVHLDPIGVSNPTEPVTSMKLISGLSNPIVIRSVTLRNADLTSRVAGVNSRFSHAESLDAFQTKDDLVVGDQRFDAEGGGYVQTGDLAPPQQYYDVLNGRPFKRQAEGRISWSAMLNPSKHLAAIKENELDPPTPVTQFIAYVLTYNRRSFSPEQEFHSTISNEPGKYGFGDAGGSLPLRRLSLDKEIPDELPVGKGSWVMLINRLPKPDYPTFSNPQLRLSLPVDGKRYAADEQGYNLQLMFAKVRGVDREERTVTIDGGPFEIFPAAIQRSDTYVVFLPEVVNVYERTVKVEF